MKLKGRTGLQCLRMAGFFIQGLLFQGLMLQGLQAQPFNNAYSQPEVIAIQNDDRLKEVSGLAAAHNRPHHFWAINDGGNSSSLLLLDKKGQYRNQLDLPHLGNHDWEDLETFSYAGQNFIAIADIGDNFVRRKVYYIHIVPEPSISKSGDISAVPRELIQTIAFQYEDGPRDAEALTIDLVNKRILLMTKRDAPPRMYSLPLIFDPKRYVYKAMHLTDVTELGRMSFRGGYLSQTLYYGLPTAMTILPQVNPFVTSLNDLTYLAVLSYGSVWFFEMFNGNPVSTRHLMNIYMPAVPQAEAMAINSDGDLTIMSEITGSKIIRIRNMQ